MSISQAVEHITNSPRETEALGARLAAALLPGDVLLLRGQLGAGKTALVRGIAAGLGSEDHVSSPTFVFIHEYSAALSMVHVDLYRLSDSSDVEDLGLRDYLGGEFLVLVEWPERVEGFDWGISVWQIVIEATAETERRFRVSAPEGREALQ